MKRLVHMIAQIDRFEDLIETRKDQITALVQPIAAALGKPIIHEEYRSSFQDGKALRISFTGYSRGSDYDVTVSIPNDVLNAADPVQAATEYRQAEITKIEEDRRVKKLTEIAELQTRIDRLRTEIDP